MTPARLGRGLSSGALHGVCMLAVEVGGTAAVLQATAGAAELLSALAGRLLVLAAQYAVVGAVLGVLTIPLADRFRRNQPPAARGAEMGAMALVWTIVAWTWNPEGVLPRGIYGGMPWGAAALGVGLSAAWVRWRWARALSAVAAVAFLGWVALPTHAPAPSGPPPAGPNVLIVVVDTLRADHVGAYGYPRDTTPTIDHLALEGARFADAATTETWTLPGHASLFTGLYTREHQAHLAHPVLEDQHTTLAELLQAAGYRTGGFSANPWLSRVSGLGQGFDTFLWLGVQVTTDAFFLPLATSRFVRHDLGGEAVTDAALDWLDASDHPFLLFLNYMEAHEPYGTVPEPFFSRYLDAPLAWDVGRRWVRNTARYQCLACEGPDREEMTCGAHGWEARPDHLVEATALYDAGIRYVDHQLGRLVAHLEATGRLDDTLVIVTADHGEALGEQGRIGHGAFLLDAVVDVPLVLRLPGVVPAGAVADDPVGLVDVLATVADATGLQAPPTQGRSLLDAARQARAGTFAEYVPPPPMVSRGVARMMGCDPHGMGRPAVMARAAGTKVVRSGEDREEVYDLRADPGEWIDLSGTPPEGAAAARALLEAMEARLVPGAIHTEGVERDPVTKEALRALGYVQ
ncbi:MAG: sulfatase [Alphaproteobacteria bacterium]|nr:sulfatase [Alphaproteobacteria bacterium]